MTTIDNSGLLTVGSMIGDMDSTITATYMGLSADHDVLLNNRENSYTTIWQTFGNNERIVIPAYTEVDAPFDGIISWHDDTGKMISIDTFDSVHSPSFIKTFPTAGTYMCKISGIFSSQDFWELGESYSNLIEVVNLGEVGWTTFYAAFGSDSLTTFNVGSVSVNNEFDIFSMEYMFDYASELTDVDFTGFIIPETTTGVSMEGFMTGCDVLESVDLTMLDLSGITSLEYAWDSCYGLTSIDFNPITPNLKNVSWMMGNTPITTFNIPNWDTSNITTFEHMFHWCDSLISVDVSGWDTSSAESINKMFFCCEVVTTLDVSNWDTSNVTDMSNTFSNCKVVTTLDVSNWDTSNVTDMSNTFSNCEVVTTLDVSNWDTSNVTDMSSVFNGCISVTSLNVTNWNTSNVTNLGRCFGSCENLSSIDINGWNISSLRKIDGLFQYTNIQSIDLSNWNTSKITDMSTTFAFNPVLTTLELDNWDMRSVKDMGGMFSGCTLLSNFQFLIDWDISICNNFSDTFSNCTSAVDIPITNWVFNLGTSCISMFNNCPLLTTTMGSSQFWSKTPWAFTYHIQAFRDSTNISNYNSIPTSWR